jgi:hypothetical protein
VLSELEHAAASPSGVADVLSFLQQCNFRWSCASGSRSGPGAAWRFRAAVAALLVEELRRVPLGAAGGASEGVVAGFITKLHLLLRPAVRFQGANSSVLVIAL